jgi:hypothetical protein
VQVARARRWQLLPPAALALAGAGCVVDIPPSPCDLEGPVAGASEMYPGGVAARCSSGADPCLLFETVSPAFGVTAAAGTVFYTVPDKGEDCTSEGADPAWRGLVCFGSAEGGDPACPRDCEHDPVGISVRGDLTVWGNARDEQLILTSFDGTGFQGGSNTGNGLVDGCVFAAEQGAFFTRTECGMIGLFPEGGQADGTDCECTAGEPVCNGAVEIVAQGRAGPTGIAVLDGSLYWIEDAARALWRATPSGADPAQVRSVSEGTGCIAQADGFLYWSVTQKGRIEAFAPSAPCSIVLVEGVNEPRAVAVDDRFVYWTSREGVWRMTKPF